jgi:hypothetical protein
MAGFCDEKANLFRRSLKKAKKKKRKTRQTFRNNL